MASKTIIEKARDSLASETAEYVNQYHKALLDNFHRLDEKFHRAILLLLFSVASFELLAHTSIVEVALGPFKLNDLVLLQKYCPLVVAYSYCSISSLGTMRHYMRELTAAVIAIKHESTVRNSAVQKRLSLTGYVVNLGKQNMRAAALQRGGFAPLACWLTH